MSIRIMATFSFFIYLGHQACGYIKTNTRHKWQLALGMVEQLKCRRLQPSLHTFNAMVSACGMGLQWTLSLRLLAEIQQHRFRPDVITFNAVISACDKGVQWQDALALLKTMCNESLAGHGQLQRSH